MKVCLTIAGLDPSGGAGIIADVKTFSAFGCFATAAITSLTFQNTTGVFGAVHQKAETLRGQVEPIVRDFKVNAVKTGMLPTREIIEETARLIRKNGLTNLVVDPVVRSTSGFDLIDDAALRSLVEMLFPISAVVTPNIPEAERISGIAIETIDDVQAAARQLRSMGARNVLIKGGHLKGVEYGMRKAESGKKIDVENSKRQALDYLFLGEELHVFEAEYFETTATHGTGCTLAAAITANLALGKSLNEAVRIAKKFVSEAIRTAPNLGSGHSPINIKPI
ncbi:MAG: bifunctional hydroxymethylpyrimidine kinase/phosphomethylpyrimidine kinase [Blastocatellia bacterium]